MMPDLKRCVDLNQPQAGVILKFVCLIDCRNPHASVLAVMPQLMQANTIEARQLQHVDATEPG